MKKMMIIMLALLPTVAFGVTNKWRTEFEQQMKESKANRWRNPNTPYNSEFNLWIMRGHRDIQENGFYDEHPQFKDSNKFGDLRILVDKVDQYDEKVFECRQYGLNDTECEVCEERLAKFLALKEQAVQKFEESSNAKNPFVD